MDGYIDRCLISFRFRFDFWFWCCIELVITFDIVRSFQFKLIMMRNSKCVHLLQANPSLMHSFGQHSISRKLLLKRWHHKPEFGSPTTNHDWIWIFGPKKQTQFAFLAMMWNETFFRNFFKLKWFTILHLFFASSQSYILST